MSKIRFGWLERMGQMVVAALAMMFSAVVVVVLYTIVELYLTGHGLVEVGTETTPLHYQVFSVLLFVVPAVVGLLIYRQLRKGVD